MANKPRFSLPAALRLLLQWRTELGPDTWGPTVSCASLFLNLVSEVYNWYTILVYSFVLFSVWAWTDRRLLLVPGGLLCSIKSGCLHQAWLIAFFSIRDRTRFPPAAGSHRRKMLTSLCSIPYRGCLSGNLASKRAPPTYWHMNKVEKIINNMQHINQQKSHL